MRKSREFYVGLVTLLSLVVLLTITFSLRNWDFFSQRTTYYALFPMVNKLNIGSPVLVFGVEAGEVSALETVEVEDYRVRVTMLIQRDVDLYPNAEVLIRPAGVIGDTTISVDAGTPDSGLPLSEGSVLRGTVSPELEELASAVSGEATETLRALSKLLNDEENQRLLKETLRNLAGASAKMDRSFAVFNEEFRPVIQELTDASRQLNQFLDSAQSILGDAGSSLDESMQHLRVTAAEWQLTALTLREAASTSTEQVNRSLGQVETLLIDNKAQLNRLVRQLDEGSRSLKEILGALERGEGTLGALLQDRRPFEQLTETLSALSRTLTGRREPAFSLPPLEPDTLTPEEPDQP